MLPVLSSPAPHAAFPEPLAAGASRAPSSQAPSDRQTLVRMASCRIPRGRGSAWRWQGRARQHGSGWRPGPAAEVVRLLSL